MAICLVAASAASAATVVVTPTNTQGWSTADTRPGGAVNFVVDGTAPAGIGALQLTTDATTAAKAQYMHDTATPLSSVTDLSYYTKQNPGTSFAQGDPSYQLGVCLDGVSAGPTCNGFTTFVYEPYQGGGGPVIPNTWQQWDVDAGQMWSSRTYTGSGSCAVVAGAGGPPFYSLATIKALCPNAVAVNFGVNIGTFNPSWDVESDLVQFNSTTYDFEPYEVATDRDQCKKDGWKNVKRTDGSSFNNQGDCIQYVNTGN
jgi:hypothetical protein